MYKRILMSFVFALFSLSLISCSDHDHGTGGHSHGSVSEQQEAKQPESDPIIHDNID